MSLSAAAIEGVGFIHHPVVPSDEKRAVLSEGADPRESALENTD